MALRSNIIPFLMLGWAQQSVASLFAGVRMAAVPLILGGVALSQWRALRLVFLRS